MKKNRKNEMKKDNSKNHFTKLNTNSTIMNRRRSMQGIVGLENNLLYFSKKWTQNVRCDVTTWDCQVFFHFGWWIGKWERGKWIKMQLNKHTIYEVSFVTIFHFIHKTLVDTFEMHEYYIFRSLLGIPSVFQCSSTFQTHFDLPDPKFCPDSLGVSLFLDYARHRGTENFKIFSEKEIIFCLYGLVRV